MKSYISVIREIKIPNASVIIQDKYEVKTTDEKFDYIKILLDETMKKANQSNIYLNFASGYLGLIPDIRTVSSNINPRLQKYFNANPKGKYGIVLMDFVEKEVIRQLINSNF